MPTPQKPFIYHGGNFIDTITVRRRNDAAISGYPYIIEMGNISLSLTGQELCDLVFSLATTAHDGGHIDEATARRLAYIGQSYEETRRCACVCGCDYKLDGYAPDEDICGACLDNCQTEPPLPEPEYDDTDERGEAYEEGR